MEASTFNIHVFVLISLTTLTISSPLNTALVTDMKDAPKEGAPLSETLKATLDKLHSHLTSWKQYFGSELESDVQDNTTDSALSVNSTVNGTKDGPTFEDFEKIYLINRTMNLLKQLVLFKEFTNSQKASDNNATVATTSTPQNQTVTVTPSGISASTTDGNRVDALLARQLRELNKMSVNQLDEVFHNVRNAARRGADISISSLCCSI